MRWTITLSAAMALPSVALAQDGTGPCAEAFGDLYFGLLTQTEDVAVESFVSDYEASSGFLNCLSTYQETPAAFHDYLYYGALHAILGLEPDLRVVENRLWLAYLQSLFDFDGYQIDPADVEAVVGDASQLNDRQQVILWAVISRLDVEIDPATYEDLFDAALRWGYAPAIEEEITHEHYANDSQRYALHQLDQLRGQSQRGTVETFQALALIGDAFGAQFITQQQRTQLFERISELLDDAIQLGSRQAVLLRYIVSIGRGQPGDDCQMIDAMMAGHIETEVSVTEVVCDRTYTLRSDYGDYLQAIAAWGVEINQWRPAP